MKEFFKAFGILLIPTITIAILFILNTWVINLVNHKGIVILVFWIMLALLWFWGFIIYKYPLNLNKLPKFSENSVLFFYAIFIGGLANGFSEFFKASTTRDYIVSFGWIVIALIFLFMSYRRYFVEKKDYQIAHDFLLSLSASLIVGTVAVLIDKNVRWDSNMYFLLVLTIIFSGASFLLVKNESKDNHE